MATTGSQLLPDTAVKTLCNDLLPETFILSPNVPEANLILEESGVSAVDVYDVHDLKRLARAVQGLGPRYVLVKGGHVPFEAKDSTASSKKVIANVLFGDDVEEVIEHPYLESKNTHGTGCSLAC